jgi:LysR family nod box-dependent transcriptional activator
LLVPSGRKLILSPLAHTLVTPLREALRSVEAVVSHTPQFDPSVSRRHFSVLASDYCLTVALAQAIQHLHERAPGISMAIDYPNDPLTRLDHNDVDLIILPQQYLSPDHPSAVLFEDDFVVVVWSHSTLAREVIDVERYFAAAHVAARFAGLHEFAENLALGAPRQRRVQLTAASFTLVPLLLPGSELIATMPQRLARIAATNLPLTLKPLPFDSPKIYEHVQWNAHQQDDPAIAWLVSTFQLVCRGGHTSSTTG